MPWRSWREHGRMEPAPRLALAVVLLGVAGADPGARRDYASLETAVDPQGAFECPCMTAHTNATFGTMLVAKGFPATYGLQGCQAYDAKLANALTGCTVRMRKQPALPPPPGTRPLLCRAHTAPDPRPETRAGVRIWCENDRCQRNVSPGSCGSASILRGQVVLRRPSHVRDQQEDVRGSRCATRLQTMLHFCAVHRCSRHACQQGA